METDNNQQSNNQSTGLPVLLDWATSQAWGLKLDTLEKMTNVLERHFTGTRLSAEQVEEIIAAGGEKAKSDRAYEVTADGRAVIPVSGIIAKYSHMVGGVSTPRGTSIEKLTEQLNAAVADRTVRAIFLLVESPGGSIAGVADFAAAVYQAGFVKPVTAFIDDTGTSAAYWIASQASAVYANQTAHVGAIGIYGILADTSELAKKEGIKFHIFRSGPHKGINSPGIKVTKENIEAIQTNIDSVYEILLSAVLRGRGPAGLDEDELRRLADGRSFIGAEAAENKLIDGITTLSEALEAELPRVREGVDFEALNTNSVNANLRETDMDQEKQTKAAGSAQDAGQQATDSERTRILAINSALSADYLADVRKKAIAEGMSLTEARAAAFEAMGKHLVEQQAAMQTTIDEQKQRLDAISAGAEEITAQTSTDADEEQASASGDSARADVYRAAVAKFQGQGLSDAKAHRKAISMFPKAHTAWLADKREKASTSK